MKRLPAAALSSLAFLRRNPLASAAMISAAAMLSATAIAHHSQAMFDTSQEMLIEGTVARFDWVNPHMYLIVDTIGPDGQPSKVEGEGLAITQALVDGLKREALQPGTAVVMRVNPNRGGWGKQVRILDVTTEDGEIHPFYQHNSRNLDLKPSESLSGKWAPSRAALNAAFGAMARWPISPEGRAAQAALVDDGLCLVEPIPFLAVLDEMRTIELGDDTVVMHFDNSGDHVLRTIYMNAEHPANLQPSPHGHSVGHWEGNTLVIDTIGYEPNTSGIAGSVPSSEGKHTVERLALADDGKRLRYELSIEDPMYLTERASLAMQWDHRPDLEFSPPSEACDPEAAARYLPHVPQ
jgi:hypothetical protein